MFTVTRSTIKLFTATVLLLAGGAHAQSGSIGGPIQKSPTGESFNTIGKSYKTQSEACNEAKRVGSSYAQNNGAKDFTLGSCGCSDRKLEGMELTAVKARENFRDNISEYVCNVDVRITYK